MPVSVNWTAKVVYIPKDYMVVVQLSPTEIRSLDMNLFRSNLKQLEASDDGIPFRSIHRHVAPMEMGGITIARAVEIINDYTITFEDGQYAVNIIGANTNLADRVNRNQVSIRTSNSAGLVTSAAIEFGEYGGMVTVDPVLGVAGSVYPIGTQRRPSSNIRDAMVIARFYGFKTIVFMRDIVLDSGDDVSGMTLRGINHMLTTLTINPGAITDSCSIKQATVTGTMDDNIIIEKSVIRRIYYYNGYIRNCTIQGTITLGGNTSANIVDCSAGIPGDDAPIIDMGGSGNSLAVRNYNGELTLVNKHGPDACSINMNAGHLIMDFDVDNGDIYVEGTAKITNNSQGSAIVHMDSVQVAEAAYGPFVFVDTEIGSDGVVYPGGINAHPVRTINDALVIADTYHVKGLSIHGVISANRSFDGMIIEGRGVVGNNVMIANGHSFEGTNFRRMTITGAISGEIFAENCIISSASGLKGIFVDCVFSGTISIAGLFQSRTSTMADHPTVFSFANHPSSVLQLDIGAGVVMISGMTSESYGNIKVDSGSVTVDSSCMGGSIIVSGNASIINNGIGVNIVDASNGVSIARKVWDSVMSGYGSSGSFGSELPKYLARIAGLVHENVFMDRMVFSSTGQLLSSRVRVFDNSEHCGLATEDGSETEGMIGAYIQVSEWGQDNRLLSYRQTRIS